MGSEPPPIPRKFAALVSHVLQPGESVVWWGRPHPWAYSRFPLAMLVGHGSTFAALVFTGVLPQPLVVGLIVSLILSPLLALLAWQWSTARRTLWLLTNERAIWCRPTWRGGYAFLETWPEDLEPIAVPRYGDPMRPNRMAYWGRQSKVLQELVDNTLRPRLLDRLKHPDNEVRRKAILTLAAQARKKKGPIASLVTALSSEDSFIRAQAAIALGKYGPHAQPAEPLLRRATFDENPAVSQAALHAIEEVRQQRDAANVALEGAAAMNRYSPASQYEPIDSSPIG